jgi:hypothetical protein
MTALFRDKVRIGQADGSEVELVVFGDEDYARYETPAGHAVIYDDGRGMFFYARLVDGRFVSSGVPLTEPAPAGTPVHAEESPAVRRELAEARRAERASSSRKG